MRPTLCPLALSVALDRLLLLLGISAVGFSILAAGLFWVGHPLHASVVSSSLPNRLQISRPVFSISAQARFAVSPIEAPAVFAHAFSARAVPVGEGASVGWRESMSAHTELLTGVPRDWAITPERVRSLGYWLKMRWIDTVRHSAQVIEGQIVPGRPTHGRASDQNVVGEPMRVHIAAVPKVQSISPATLGRLPLPATRPWVDKELLAEPLRQSAQVEDEHSTIFGLGQQPNGALDDRRLREAESGGESADESHALRREPVADSEFLGHARNVPLAAVGVK